MTPNIQQENAALESSPQIKTPGELDYFLYLIEGTKTKLDDALSELIDAGFNPCFEFGNARNIAESLTKIALERGLEEEVSYFLDTILLMNLSNVVQDFVVNIQDEFLGLMDNEVSYDGQDYYTLDNCTGGIGDFL